MILQQYQSSQTTFHSFILDFSPWRSGPHLADPHGHLVGAGRTVVQVEDDHAEDDRKCDQDHGEHDVVDDDGDSQRRLWDLIGQQQQEDSEGEQHVDGQTHLLSWQGKKMLHSVLEISLQVHFHGGWSPIFTLDS